MDVSDSILHITQNHSIFLHLRLALNYENIYRTYRATIYKRTKLFN